MNLKTQSKKPKVIFIDVDDTLIRTVGTKRIPIPHVIAEVKRLSQLGHQLFCWSSGGAEYSREVAEELGLQNYFENYLSKPQLLIDDQHPSDWRYLEVKHPNEVG